VRAELAGHVEPGREDLEPVRDARRAAGRGLAPCRVNRVRVSLETADS
jgi:hypothetical protein